MKAWNVWIDFRGVSDNILKADYMREAVRKEAETIRSRCGDGYEVDIVNGKNRTTANVYPATSRAIKDNYQNNTLLKAVK